VTYSIDKTVQQIAYARNNLRFSNKQGIERLLDQQKATKVVVFGCIKS
jgi:hypothetical protein